MIGWVTVTQIRCKAAEIFHIDALLTHYFCNTPKSYGRLDVGPVISPGQSQFWPALSPLL